jgi:hypothetical protein
VLGLMSGPVLTADMMLKILSLVAYKRIECL